MVGPNQGVIVNMTDRRAERARRASVEVVQEGPSTVAKELMTALGDRNLQMPAHHEVRPTDVFMRRLHGVVALANERGAGNFEDLLITRGLGPRTLQALALVSEVAFGAPSRFDDPARFAFAHGGKYIIQLLYDSIEDLNIAISSPVDLSMANRIDAGHFAGSEEAFRHWDEDGAVPGSCSRCHSADGVQRLFKEGVNITEDTANGLNCTTS